MRKIFQSPSLVKPKYNTKEILNTYALFIYGDIINYCGPGSSVGIATECGLDGPESNPGGDEILLRPTQPPVK